MPHAVKEINQEPDSEPDHKTNPGHHRQAQHQSQAHEYAEDWKNRNERDTKWTRSFGIDAAQHVHTEANQNKREERADVGEICELANVCNHRHAGDYNSGPNSRDVRCPEARMNFGKILWQQTVARHRHENPRLPKLKDEQH